MRRNNMGGALGALLLAGAAYAWKNRDRLGQQLNTLRSQRGLGTPDTGRQPQSLPDYSNVEQRDFTRETTGANEREFGGTQV